MRDYWQLLISQCLVAVGGLLIGSGFPFGFIIVFLAGLYGAIIAHRLCHAR